MDQDTVKHGAMFTVFTVPIPDSQQELGLEEDLVEVGDGFIIHHEDCLLVHIVAQSSSPVCEQVRDIFQRRGLVVASEKEV